MSAEEVVEEAVEEGAKLVESASAAAADGLYVSKGVLAFGSFVGGLTLVGVGYGAYRLAVRQTTVKYEKILKEQIAEAKAFYSLAHKKGELSTPEKAVAHLHVKHLQDSELVGAVEALNQYQGTERDTEEEQDVNVFVEHRPEDENFDLEVEMRNRGPDAPYVIDQNEFLEAEPGYDQITITYYEGDGTLADDGDQEIPHVDPIVGQENLQRFGHGSGDDRIVYIRNERMLTDFEVIKSDGKYAHEVLGLEHSDGGERGRRLRNQPRKFRGDDE